MNKNTKHDIAGPSHKRNAGDTKGYAEDNPGRHSPRAGKEAKQRASAEKIGTRERKSVR